MLHTELIPVLQVCKLLPINPDKMQFLEELYLELRPRNLPPSEVLQRLTAAVGGYFEWVELEVKVLKQEAVHEYFVKPVGENSWLVIQPGTRPTLQHISPLESKRIEFTRSKLRKFLTEAQSKEAATGKQRWLHFIPNQSPGSKKVTPFQRLVTLLRLERSDLRLIFIYSVVLGVLELGVPVTIQALVNNVAFGVASEPVFVLTFILLMALGIMAVLKTFRLIIVEMLQRRVFTQVAQETAQRLVHVDRSLYQDRRLPELVNRFLDVVTVQKGASFLLLDGLTLLLQTVAGLSLLAFYHPYLLFFDLVLILAMLFVLFVLGIGAVPTSIKESGQKYAATGWLQEIAAHDILFKPIRSNRYAIYRTQQFVQKYLKARDSHFQVLLRQNIGAFTLQAIAGTALLGLGGWLVVQQTLTIGQLVAAELIVAGVVSGFAKIGKYLESYYDLMAAMDKLGYLFDLPQEPERLNLLPHQSEGINLTFDSVSAPGDSPVELKNFNFELKAGQKLGIVGALTPMAKYFMDVLQGVQEPASGWVLIDDQPLHHLRLSEYRSQVVQLSQLEIIQDTVLNNLRLSEPDLTRQQAQHLLEQTGLWDTVKTFPDLLDTQLGIQGQPFSLPQAYRLMLARALAMKPRLLILDRVMDSIEWEPGGPIHQWITSKSEMTVIVLTQIVPLARCFERVMAFNPDTGGLEDFEGGEA